MVEERRPAALTGRRAAAAGLLAAAVGLGVGELVAGLVGPRSSPVLAVAGTAVALTPGWLREFAIGEFGSADKAVLVGGVLVVLAVCAALVGLLARRSPRLAAAGVGLLAAVGAAAALTRPGAGALDALPSVAAAVAGAAALLVLVAPVAVRPDRRRFLAATGIALGAAVVAGGGGRLLQRRSDVEAARAALRLPRPASPAPALPAGADLSRQVPGLTPLTTPNGAFYRVDTALTVPRIRPDAYLLTLTGMFARPRSYTLHDLLGRADLVERDVTLTCVSNEVGGTLTGNARWLGVPLAALLRENRIDAGSTQLVLRSADGMTIGASTRAALTTPGAMLAVGMNGQPLPLEHGFPVRVVIPGQYGYVSACKWLTGIEASTYEAHDAYWVQRGYARRAPVKVSSRIDTPSDGRAFPAGVRAVAGVAWAQARGIGRVEVRVDDGGWEPARLSPSADPDTWRQWVLPHDFAPGGHRITVRATTADGELQTAARTGVVPDGATGWHTVRVTAT